MEEEVRRRRAHAWRWLVNNPPTAWALCPNTSRSTPPPLLWFILTTRQHACRRTCNRNTAVAAMKERRRSSSTSVYPVWLQLLKSKQTWRIRPRAFHRQMSIHSRVLPSMLWSTQREGRCDQWWLSLHCFFFLWGWGGPYNTCSLPGMPTDTV